MDDDRFSVIAELIAQQPGDTDDQAGLLRRVCGAAAQALSASGAGVSVMTVDGARGATAASDPLSERFEELQFVLGEGPCIDAFATRRPVLVPDLGESGPGAGRRWPFYTPAARQAGLRAVFAFPLQIGAARLGVLDVFRTHIGPLSGTELADALAFAEVTVTTMLDQQEDAGIAGLDDADEIGYRSELAQAQGMVMVQLGVTIAEAMVRIRAYAYAEDRRLADVARDVVARRLRFDSDVK
ncbi:GAF and ANTAR domain-containing protein [Micromonospora sp. NPDC050795]|uniref:GAF and ANTAR domain-containing protein n=1 Tax=Micromonospora sp. NPDC050795 TaxID=3364282 RepID=UPI003793362A